MSSELYNEPHDMADEFGAAFGAGEPLERMLVQTVRDYWQHGYDNIISKRIEDWNRSERYAFAQVDWDEIDYMKRRGTPTFEDPIVLPTTRTFLDSRAAKLFQMWRKRRPPLPMRPRNSNQALQVKKAEAQIAWNCQKMRIDKLMLYRYRHMDMYGYSPRKIHWDDERQMNVMHPWDPYHFVWDPYVPVDRLQDGKFVAFQSTEHIIALKRADLYFNLDSLRGIKDSTYIQPFLSGVERGDIKGGTVRDEIHGIQTPHGYRTKDLGKSTNVLHEAYWWMIPADFFKHSKKALWRPEMNPTKPVIAVATVANGETLIRFDYIDADTYPAGAISALADYFTIAPMGEAQIILGLQRTADWLVNSNIEEVKVNLNGIWVFDPSRIHGPDLSRRQHGMNIAVRKQSYGGPVKDALYQVPAGEVTAGFIDKALRLLHFAERESGATEPIQGASVEHAGKRTAFEVGTLKEGAEGRFGMLAGLFDEQDSEDMLVHMYENIRRYMRKPLQLQLTADIAALAKLNPKVDTHFTVQPGDFDDVEIQYEPFDEQDLMRREKAAEIKMQIVEMGNQYPWLGQRLDMFEFVKSIVVRDLGVSDFDQFVKDEPGPTEGGAEMPGPIPMAGRQPMPGPATAMPGGPVPMPMPAEMPVGAPMPMPMPIPMNGGVPVPV